ncbi:MAG: copper resistance protein B [Novosphingobium sp.]|nr:copper resistance protein B [Novosphingobium sp.]
MKALLLAGAALLVTAPAMAQQADPHAGHDMTGMDHSAHEMPQSPAADPHAGHDMGAMQAEARPDTQPDAHPDSQPDAAPAMDHSAHMGHAMPTVADGDVGNAPPPPVPTDHPADAFWDRQRMAAARAALDKEGAFFGNALIADRLEYRPRNGQDGYAWQVMGWVGGDIDRLSFETEGEAAFGEPLETAEVRAGWRHAIDPWWNFELGVRQDFGAGPDHTYGVIGFEGLAPYWFEVGAHAFVSNKGDVHFRLEAEHDMRLTQRLILQPSVEIDASAQDVPELGIGAGLEKIELGTRLRYEFAREFAPYVGVHWERKLGETARLTRAGGESASQVSAVVGLRMWF